MAMNVSPVLAAEGYQYAPLSRRSIHDPDRVLRKWRNINYPKELWWTLACFIFLVSFFQLGSTLYSRFTRRQQQSIRATHVDPEHSSSQLRRGVSLRRIPLALVNAYRVVAFRWTLELGHSYTLNFAEVALTMLYIATLFTWEFINTTDAKGHKLDVGYWGNRAGSLAASQFPLITALGTKNNVVSLVTGISYDKLNYMHRMTARVVFVLLWVHAGAKIQDGLYPDLDELFLRAGIFAIVAFSLLCLVSMRPVRAGAYEIFFYAHFSMVLIFLVGAYYHVKDFNFDPYIYSSFIIWGLDRLIRFIRVVIFNHSYFGFKSGSGTLDANTELLSDQLVRLRFRRPSHFHWKAGQTAYLILPSVSSFPFEAHPFTIASYDSSAADNGKLSDEKALEGSAPYWKELVFLINVRKGFTKRLRDVATTNGTVRVFVDGPYGPAPDQGPFDICVLVAGGAGVSYTLPVLLDVIERVRKGTSGCHKIVFIWAIRNADHVHWISDTLLKALQIAPQHLEISVRIHCTGANTWSIKCKSADRLGADDESIRSGLDTVGAAEEKERYKENLSVLSLPAVSIAEGRPDLHNMLLEEVEAATGRMSVTVCGSQEIASTVRRALRFPVSGPTSILKGGPSVSLHVESYGYA